MTKLRNMFFAVLVIISIFALSAVISSRSLPYPYPEIKISPISKFAALDMSGVLLGARRLAADIAWIELLQYYGSPEQPLDKETEFKLSWDMTKYLFGLRLQQEDTHKPGDAEKEHYHPEISGGVYQDLYSYCLRVTELDPFFSYAYLYGAGSLAWNLNRPDEAIKLLENGISSVEKYSPDITKDAHQPFWQYHLYLSAIIYSKSGQFDEMITLLETAVRQPQCPNMVKAILANIYQKNGKSERSMKLWLEIYDSKDPTYIDKSLGKISELQSILGLR